MSSFAVMNNTKWKELQKAMYELGESSPQWRTKCLTNGFISAWDGEWYYHFSVGGFKDIEWVEIRAEDDEGKGVLLSELRKIHVPGVEIENGYRVYGYIEEGKVVDYV